MVSDATFNRLLERDLLSVPPEDRVIYPTLRKANEARQAEWDPSGTAKDLNWRVNELFGEAGEAANIIKKLHRERCGIPGSRATKDQLAEELADILICLDLFSMDAGGRLPENYNSGTHRLDGLLSGGVKIGQYVGRLCEFVNRLHSGLTLASEDDLTSNLRALWWVVCETALREGIDMRMAVAAKFNATSAKVGLKTYLRYED